MALGGGSFLSQNKILPGAYINFISASRASASLSDRGYCALALELDWGPENQVFTVTNAEFEKESRRFFGYSFTDEKLKGLRDLFQGAQTAYFYRLNPGEKASNSYGAARYSGVRGNGIRVTVQQNADDSDLFDVTCFLDAEKTDSQTVSSASELKDNDFVIWKKGAQLTLTAGEPMTGGANGAGVSGDAYQKFLDAIEAYNFNILGCLSTDKTVCGLFLQFTKRMRDEQGVKFQTVLYRPDKPDYEGIIALENKALGEGAPESALVYWLMGAEAGCKVHESVSNKIYTGEFEVDTAYTQAQLEAAVRAGRLAFHRVGSDARVLTDINSFISATNDKSADFSSNQTIRVLDQIGNDIALLFNSKYIGTPNDDAGRISFWADIVSHHKQLEKLRAIENFTSDSVTVKRGESKKAVEVEDRVTPVNAMEQLYMTVRVE